MILSFLKPNWRDVVDVLLVAVVFYYFLKYLRGTRALRMLVGLFVIFLISLGARWLNFKSLGLLVDSLKAFWVVAFVILFQPEIRNALGRFGRFRPFRFLLKSETEIVVIGEIVGAVAEMKERGIGGLIVLERSIGLRDFVETGIAIEAKVSAPLLVSVFTPPSPLHDGACIIVGDTIVAAGCTLPLSDVRPGTALAGMRHRAGLGIASLTDAVAVVVSETSGRISFCSKGQLETNLALPQLKQSLTRALLKEG
jgi:diadenylate cyclase